MRIEIRCRDMQGQDGVRAHAEKKIRFHFQKLGPDVDEVTLRIGDENGPRGGVDKACHLVITGPKIGVITVEEENESTLAAIDVAVERGIRAARKALSKLRVRSRDASATIRRAS